MKQTNFFATIAMGALALGAAPAVSAQGWAGDLQQALTRSKESGKDLLIYFSGSQWDNGTKVFEEKVTGTDGFASVLSPDFDLVNLDFPRNARLDPTSKGKVEWADRYGVQRLPLVVLTDKMGRPYEHIQPATGSFEEFARQIAAGKEAKKKRDQGLAAAAELKGPEKAQALIDVLETLSRPTLTHFYQSELAAIEVADPETGAAFVKELEAEVALKEEQKKYRKLIAGGDMDKVLSSVEEDRKGADKETEQRLTLYRIQALARQNKFQEAKAEVDKMAAILPESDYAKQADTFKSTIDKFEERQKRMKEAIAKKPTPAAKPAGPIVSKPVAIVSDPKVLYEDLAKFSKARVAAREAKAKAEAAKKSNDETIAALEKQLSDAKAQLEAAKGKVETLNTEIEQTAKTFKDAVTRHTTMLEIIETHKEMEAKKKAAKEADKEEKASAPQVPTAPNAKKAPAAPKAEQPAQPQKAEAQKQAEDLKKKAEELAQPKG